MRKLFMFTLLIGLLSLTLAVSAQDEGPVVIVYPLPVYHVSGTFDVYGIVNPEGLQNYFLEVAEYEAYLAAPDDESLWTPVTLPASQPVDAGIIAQWDTTLVPDGVYALRVRAFVRGGDPVVAVTAPIRVANTGEFAAPVQAVAQAAPTATTPPTPEPTPTPIPRPVINNELPLPVGAQFDNFDQNAADLASAAGLTWIKWQIPFVVGDDSLIQVARDRIDWSHQNGFLVFLSIKGERDQLAELGDEYFPLYADFVGRIAEYQPDAIQVWNEQNLDREWPNGQIDPEMYVDLLQPAYEAIKAVDPTIHVVTGAPAPTGAEGAFGLDAVWNDDRYYAGMAQAGAADYADCIGIHYNEGIIPPNLTTGDPRDNDYPTRYFPSMMQRAATPFRNLGIDIPLCFSELGYLSPDGYGELPSGFAWGANTSEQEQAEWLRDAIALAAQTSNVRVELIIIFNMNYTRFVEGDPQGGYAIIRPDGNCPACDAIATLRRS